jgi:hypothetical protein
MITQLLDGASMPVTERKMMYRAVLFWDQLKKYLVMMGENILLHTISLLEDLLQPTAVISSSKDMMSSLN